MKYVSLFTLQLFILGMVMNISPHNSELENIISLVFLSSIVPLVTLLADSVYSKTN